MKSLVKDIHNFWEARQNRIYKSEAMMQIENVLDAKTTEFRKLLPPELIPKFNELEDLCVNKRYLCGSYQYKAGYKDGAKVLIYTLNP